MTGDRRASPKTGEIGERIRSFRGSRGFVVAVVRNVSDGHIYNVENSKFEDWPEA